ncbi:hypothetical protein BDZ89DRAFT_1079786 [Hymenopellis radicata]|nr:hypothetical protein BDZ89DRAFT_1079786 [Hymenopellis radicata]
MVEPAFAHWVEIRHPETGSSYPVLRYLLRGEYICVGGLLVGSGVLLLDVIMHGITTPS